MDFRQFKFTLTFFIMYKPKFSELKVHNQQNLMTLQQRSIYFSGCNNTFMNNFCSNLGNMGQCVNLRSVSASVCASERLANNLSLNNKIV